MTAAHTQEVTARVVRLVHYPVKGLAGVELEQADLAVGGGFPHDRAVAISNGSAPIDGDGEWISPSRLYGLARNPGLTRLGVRVGDTAGTPATVTAVGEDVFVVHLDDWAHRADELESASECVRGIVAPGPNGLPGVVLPGVPLWRRPEGAVSIVNLATLRLLEQSWGVPLDPRRFRANVYVDGLAPWEELGLVGGRLRVGGVDLEVTAPVLRGAGCGVDPDDGSTRLDVSGLLLSRVGHRYLGVYARVVGAGRVARGDAVTASDPARAQSLARDVASLTEWPRRADVVRVVEEGHSTLSLWLRDPLGLADGTGPGQHVRLHVVDDAGPTWRKYTVSGVDAGLVRLSIALEQGGRISEYLRATAHRNLDFLISGPFGEANADPAGESPLLMLSAGIGITPTLALLREVAARAPHRPVGVLHVARGEDPAMWEELVTLVERVPGTRGRVSLHLTAAGPRRCGQLRASAGRPTASDVARVVASLPTTGLVALVCGPDGFRADVRAALCDAGVPDAAILMEAFFSPPPEREVVPPASQGPFRVRFSRSGGSAIWKPEVGSLLDLAESQGLRPPVDCREAACNLCATAVTGGDTMYTTPPMGPPPGKVLICCAVPTSDVTVDL